MNSLTKKIIQSITYTMLLLALAGITACGGGDVDPGEKLLTCELPLIPDAAGQSCVAPPPIQCPAPTVPNASNDECVVGANPDAPEPSVFPTENQAIFFYNRTQDATNLPSDPAYTGYVLHTWNNEACDSYAAPFDSSTWGEEHDFSGIDPNYGAYWILELKPDHGDCANFVLHIGTDDAGKELGGGDWTMNLAQDDPVFTRMNWTLSGFPAVFEYPITSLGALPLQIKDFAAHWIDATTFIWNIDASAATEVRLHHSATADIKADENDQLNGNAIVLTSTEQSAEQQAAFPATASWAAFQIDVTAEQAKAILKNQLVVAAYDGDGAYAATYVQTANVIDNLYTSGDDDADEANLGLTYSAEMIDVALWAPTAQQVKLKIYDAGKTLSSTQVMILDAATGIWRYSANANVDRQFYRYEISVYHPQNNAIEIITTTDPYSVSLSTNGDYSQFVNLDDSDLKPTGWDGHAVATITDPEDAVIYEGHIRDFSVRDESTSEANRGKYLAFTESASAPMQHLSELAANGMTHFHMLPANDIASINEDPDDIVDLTHTVADLCAVNANAPVCGVESNSATLLSLMQGYMPYSIAAQALAESMRGYDSFNWGYDPKHFNVPDGIYASDPDGTARILEMRAMNLALHDAGLRVVLDVVYNHTNSAGLWDNSVFDKIVPGYYYRRDLISGNVQQSTCCNDTALEHRMMDKFMTDSLVQWASQYGFDGFRFDIMSHGSVAQMLAARDSVRAIDPDNYFYGEGWFRNDGRADQANQQNLAGSQISTFNDRLRDGVRSAALFNGDDNDGAMNNQDIVKLGMAGTLANYVLKSASGVASTGSSFSPAAYALDPADVINYVSKHDDNTLWDQLQFNLPANMSLEDRVRSQNIAAAIPLMSQGVPFLQVGGDMMRSKSMDRNSYDAGDWFNYVDFTMGTNNWNVGLPLAQDNSNKWETIVGISSSSLTAVGMSDVMFASTVFKEFLSIRRDSKLFRLTTQEDILARVGFHNLGSNQTQGVIVMSIDDGIDLTDIDPNVDALLVMINATDSAQSHTVLTAEGFELHATQQASMDARVATASFSAGTGEGTFNVPARSMAVFVKPQGAAQGAGLSAYATSGAPDVVPYGATSVYLRGDMNGWGAVDAFEYIGDGVYQIAVPLSASTNYNFKIASEDWSTVNFGSVTEGSDQIVIDGEDKTLARTNFNLQFTPSIDATYLFKINASDSEAPVLNVVNEEPFVGTTVYLRGDMNGWGTTAAFNYDGGRIYTVAANLDAGSYNFKVASEDWSTVNFGAVNDSERTVELGVEEILAQTNDNLNITITDAGSYVFIFDMTNLMPKLRVFNQEFFAGVPVFLRGDMNGWGTVDELAYANGSYSIDLALAAGNYNFKVASEDWSTVNFGAENSDSTSVELGLMHSLFVTNDNLNIDIVIAATYRFSVTGPDGSAPQITVTEVVP